MVVAAIEALAVAAEQRAGGPDAKRLLQVHEAQSAPLL